MDAEWSFANDHLFQHIGPVSGGFRGFSEQSHYTSISCTKHLRQQHADLSVSVK